MTRDALNRALNYIEDQNTPVQITYDLGEYTLDFKHKLHAGVCHDELKSIGFNVTLNPEPYYARVQ